MNEPVKHHYLPEFYLKYWASSSDSRVQYFYWEGKRFISSRISPKNTGYECNLYSLKKVAPEDSQTVEKFLNKEFDSPASLILKKIKSDGVNNLSAEEKELCSRFFFSLKFRGPAYIEKTKEHGEQFIHQKMKQEYGILNAKQSPNILLEVFESLFPGGSENISLTTWATTLKNSKVIAKLGELYWWTINLKGSSYQLLTSDSPFIILNKPIRSIFAPIGPYEAFFASESPEIEQRFLQLSKNKQAKAINREIVCQAKLKVYAKNNLQENFIKKHIPKPM